MIMKSMITRTRSCTGNGQIGSVRVIIAVDLNDERYQVHMPAFYSTIQLLTSTNSA